MTASGLIIDTAKLPTNGRIIRNYLEKYKGKKIIALEDCDISAWLFEILKKVTEEVIVCNPVKNTRYKSAKTDKLDAKMLADLLRGNFLSQVYHNGSAAEKLRTLMSAYEDSNSDLTRLKNRYRALYRRNGINVKKGVYSDSGHIELLRESSQYYFVAKNTFERIQFVRKTKIKFHKEIKKEAKKFKAYKYLITIPGIGHIHAAHIIAQIINPRRFLNKHKLFAYSGLVRHDQISGGNKYGSKKIHGNRILKCVFKRAAESAINSNSALSKLYEDSRDKGHSHKQSRNAVARKIASIARGVWINSKAYSEERVLNNLAE